MNNNLDIKVKDLHWLNNDSTHDLCLHGNVKILFGDTQLKEILDETWTINAMVLELMRSCFENFDPQTHTNYIVPCCGHSMFEDKNNSNKVVLFGCSNGFSWDIRHENDSIIHSYSSYKIRLDN